MKSNRVVLAAGLVLAAYAVEAQAAMDTSKPVICAATQVVGCGAASECVRATPETFNLPVLFKIDIANKVAESARAGGETRVSAIASVTQVDDVVVLQGVDAADGWSARINVSSGQLTIASVDEGAGYVVFGTCSVL